jgi:hypothetical protein
MSYDSGARKRAIKVKKLALQLQSTINDNSWYRGAQARWSATSLSNMSDGTNVKVVPDLSGNGNSLTPPSGGTFMTKQTDSQGYPCIRGDGTAQLFSYFGGFPAPIISAPTTFVFVVAASTTAGTRTALLQSGTAGNLAIAISSGITGTVFADGNSLTMTKIGPSIMDGAKHIVIVVTDTTSESIYIDGYLVTASTAGNFLGSGMALPYISFKGDLYEASIIQGRMPQDKINSLTKKLASDWGVSTAGTYDAADGSSYYESGTTSDGSTYRLWVPDRPSNVPVLVLWSHPQGQNEQIAPGYFAYSYIHTLRAMGYYVAASSMGYAGSPGTSASSWGNSTAQTSLSQLYTLCASRIGSTPNVVLVGASMGGMANAQAIIENTIPNVKAAFFIDAVFDLYNMYKSSTYSGTIDLGYNINTGTLSSSASAGATSISSSVSFANGTILSLDPLGTNPELVTVNGTPTGSGPYTIPLTNPLVYAHNSGVKVSDYGTKTSGKNPMVGSVSNFSGLRTRFIADPSDTAVNKVANTDSFVSRISSITLESNVITKAGGHLAGGASDPRQLVDLIKRSIVGS